jgi:hypothetical protein
MPETTRNLVAPPLAPAGAMQVWRWRGSVFGASPNARSEPARAKFAASFESQLMQGHCSFE